MTMKKVYSCNICSDEMPANNLIGLRFSNLKQFKFSHARQTDGIHICKGCLKQIVQLGGKVNFVSGVAFGAEISTKG